jgi:hypothetical protein
MIAVMDGREGTGSAPARRRWAEPAAVAGALGAYCWGVAFIVATAPRTFFPPDAAHALGEADRLLGRGVLDFAHPPVFAGLVAVLRAMLGPVPGVQAAFIVSLALLWLATYVLLRQWSGPIPSLVGAMTGMSLPLIAELLGWGGGAQLLGVVFGVATLAAFERWARVGRGGPWVGAGVGLTALTHPFGLMALLAVLGLRWAVELGGRGARPTRRWSPTSVGGIAVAVAWGIPFAALSMPYYRAVAAPGAVSLGPPSSDQFDVMLSWATRETSLLYALCLASLGGALFARRRGQIATLAALAGVVVIPLVFVRAEAGYVGRSLYYLPVLVALAVAAGWDAVAPAASGLTHHWRLAVGVLAGLALPGLVAGFGLAPRLRIAIPWYSPLDDADIATIALLRGSKGSFATSWPGVSVATGGAMSWYASGLAHRPAYGASGRWITAQPAEQREGLEMQRAFSGGLGVDGGDLQVAAQGDEISLQVRVRGVYRGFAFPAFVIAPRRDPAGARGMASTAGSTVSVRDQIQTLSATLGANSISVRQSGRLSAGRPIWLRPAPGAQWVEVVPRGEHLHLEQVIADQRLRFDIRTKPGGQLVFTPYNAAGGGAAVRLDVPRSARTAGLHVAVSGAARSHPPVAYRQREILRRYGVSKLVVMRSSGALQRFDPTCYPRTAETPALVVLSMAPPCRRSVTNADEGHLASAR